MKLHQLRYLCEIAKRDLSFSNAAAALHTSQPGISKQMRLLEQELGVDLFVRSGNRISDLTEPGRRIVDIAAVILRQTDSIKAAAHEFLEGHTGRLNVAATFTLGRYVLPGVLQRFVVRYPQVQLELLHGSSDQVCKLVVSGEADIALTAGPAAAFPELLMLEYAQLPRALFVPRKHPLATSSSLSLKTISAYPLVTLHAGSRGQAKMRERFLSAGLEPNIVLSGPNIDVVKAFVEAGLGIAVLPRLAFDPVRDSGLRALDVDHLFEPHRANLAIRRNHYLRGYALDFIQMVAPKIDRRTVEQAGLASK
ncbi:MAG: transcriptional regulator, LysR family [Betaproteobacteria bacterium]|jgi:LysR family cys regulon transcriptional activator|nr:transcriptional regulator, LysR family [Betaproteobacteria bacterium]